EAAALGAMTFPSYRHLLDLRPAPRHPEQGDDRVIQPVAVAAHLDGRPVGLALAETPAGPPADEPEAPEVPSAFRPAEPRPQGVATALLERLEAELRARGFTEVKGTFMSGRASNDALVRVLVKRGWEPPAVRTVTLRFTPRGSRDTPWYGRLQYSNEYEVFPW